MKAGAEIKRGIDWRFPNRPGTTDRTTHGILLAFALLFVISPFFLSCSYEVDSPMFLARWRLPPSCASKQLFNQQCPGCGMSHSFVQLTHGNLRASLNSHRLGALLYLFFLYQIGFRIVALTHPDVMLRSAVRNVQHYLSSAMVILLLGNWLLTLLVFRTNGS